MNPQPHLTPSQEHPDGSPMEAAGPDPEDVPASLGGKLLLTIFPFVVALLFFLVEWWLRGRS